MIYIQLLSALHVDQREADCLSSDCDWASWDLLCLWAQAPSAVYGFQPGD